MLLQIIRTLLDAFAIFTPCPIDARQHLHEPWPIEPGSRRKVCAPEEWPEIWQKECGEGPSSTTGHRSHRIHVCVVDVWKVFTIDLDGDEVLVHELCDFDIGKGLTSHHVTPVAGGVTDGQEDGPIQFSCPGKRFLTPRVPLDRILGVFPKIGAGTVGETPATFFFVTGLLGHSRKTGIKQCTGADHPSIHVHSPRRSL